MRRTGLLLATAALAMLLAGGVAFLGVKGPAEAAFPGNNGRLVFVQGGFRGDIHTVLPDGTGLKQITYNGLSQDPAWSADGRIAFSRWINGDYEIYVKNTNGGLVTRLTNNEGDDMTPTWSPDGSQIAYQRGFQTWVMGADGSEQRDLGLRVNTPLLGSHDPAWSPDGTKIAVAAHSDIWVVNSDGSGGAVRVTDTRAQEDKSAGQPNWSPDGTKIAFSAKVAGCCYLSDVYVVNADGTGSKNVTDTPAGVASEENPAWSPDGRKIAYHFHEPGSDKIYKMNPDGTNRQPIRLYDGGPPDWRPQAVAPG